MPKSKTNLKPIISMTRDHDGSNPKRPSWPNLNPCPIGNLDCPNPRSKRPEPWDTWRLGYPGLLSSLDFLWNHASPWCRMACHTSWHVITNDHAVDYRNRFNEINSGYSLAGIYLFLIGVAYFSSNLNRSLDSPSSIFNLQSKAHSKD